MKNLTRPDKNLQNRGRLAYIDMAKAAALALMILFHHQGIQNTLLQRIGTAFHMPIFFFLYGLASRGGEAAPTVRSLVFQCFKKLMIPYYLWMAIYINMRQVSMKSILLIIRGSNLSVQYADGNAALWFLCAMFLAACVFGTVTFYGNKCFTAKERTGFYLLTVVAASFGSAILRQYPLLYGYPFNADVALTGYAFIMLGNLAKPLFRKMEKMSRLILGACSLVLCAATFFLAQCNGIRTIMDLARYGNYILFVLGGTVGSVAVAAGMLFLEKVLGKTSGLLAWFGRHSLFIFASHTITFNLLTQLYRYLSLPMPQTLGGQCLYTVLTMILCGIACKMAGRYVPALEGK